MAAETFHIHLKHCPAHIKDLIEREQARRKYEDNEKIKQEYVIYDMLSEWYQQKTKIQELEASVNEKRRKQQPDPGKYLKSSNGEI
jgi:hypothetical protein